MPSRPPLVLKLPRPALARKDAIRNLLSRLDLRLSSRAEIEQAFAFKDDELMFARALADRTHLWLFRVNQRAFAGDFLVVDVSCPSPARRAALALDLKRGQRVRADRPGIQMGRTGRAIATLAARGIVGEACVPIYMTGDARSLLASIDEALARARTTARARV